MLIAMEPMMKDASADRLTMLFDSTPQTRRRIVTAGGSALIAAGLDSILPSNAAFAQVLSGTGDQSDWRFCDRCFSLFYSKPNVNNGYTGKCPAGGVHHAQGFTFTLHYDSAKIQPVAGRDSQFDWRFCSKCFCIYWAPANPPLKCAANGNHAAYGFIFGLAHDNPANPGQPNWRSCQNCGTLFFDDPKNPFKGACPASGSHVRAGNSFNFQLPFVSTSNTTTSGTNPGPATLGQKIVTYATAHVNQCVTDTNGNTQGGMCTKTGDGDTDIGPGECTYLVHSAVVASGGQPPNYNVPKTSAINTDTTPNQNISGYLYQWGDPVSPPYQPGDIVQLAVAKLQGANGFWQTTSQHTAIIKSVGSGNDLTVINQHAPNRIVTIAEINLNWSLVRGKFQVFRVRPR